MNIVYLLGAGFSADLGIPTLASFRQRAGELQANKKGDFREANKALQRVLHGNRYYSPDVNNIEEVLSMLEIARLAGLQTDDSVIRKYIIDVITTTTPELGIIEPDISLGTTERWWSRLPNLTPEIRDKGRIWWDYCSFVGGLHSTTVSLTGQINAGVSSDNLNFNRGKSEDEYTVITLNYDRVLEQITDFFNSRSTGNNDFISMLPDDSLIDLDLNERTKFIKLHGCISRSSSMRTPTWNKVFGGEDTMLVWREATKALANAHYVRIVGYSMPASDSHVGSLLKYTFATNLDLLGVDVIDNSENTIKSYKNQIGANSSRWNFCKLSARWYLQRLWELQTAYYDASLIDGDSEARRKFEFKFLRKAHDELVSEFKRKELP